MTEPNNYSGTCESGENLQKTEKSQAPDPQWELFRAGNKQAFETLFKQYYPLLLNYGLRRLKERDEVKDCIQSLFLTLWERRQHLGPSSSAKNYLLASLRRLLIKRQSQLTVLTDMDEDRLAFEVELSHESIIIQDQVSNQNIFLLRNAVDSLPARQKEALYLKFYHDRSFSDIAAVMNISTRAVYKLIYKALDTLNLELSSQKIKVFL